MLGKEKRIRGRGRELVRKEGRKEGSKGGRKGVRKELMREGLDYGGREREETD